ncbi:oxalate decarboxylase family bicupin [Mytilinidion resinicola]|uniref:Oxalate decarboxylase family bicupin n=1 Tax=Mytilinidion resinicola TaxID=574789 RepID=A0A6A6YYK2_9PEZI|nr:oxalate decarboxylase family bicupin [Mytilinidion resinicola]KAF2813628.1 oxalate decarboxylase family bicupin [Mytilinidion resinicola]
MRWSFADSHVRIEEGGWTRQTTIRELPTSVELAGVNMRLDEGVIRELHWHKEAEWAYVLEGNVRITALDPEGGSFVDDLEKGDLWYFPSGYPHSLQGLSPNGTEFLLIFDDGNFSEESTFLLTDWLAHTPKSVIGENFRLAPEVFNALPASEKYIFQGSVPGSIADEIPKKGYKKSALQFTHKMLAQEALNATGGTVRITDSTNFPISKTVAAAHLTIEPNALREMHWHPNADEWSFFIRGRARVTIFGSSGTARTFDYGPGDVGIVPRNMGHFIENLSDEEEVEVLEIFRADKFQDFSLFEWLGETPQRLVREHLFKGREEEGRKFEEAIKGAGEDPIRGVPVEGIGESEREL